MRQRTLLTPGGSRRARVPALTIEDFVILMTWHDENHPEQLERALRGEP